MDEIRAAELTIPDFLALQCLQLVDPELDYDHAAQQELWHLLDAVMYLYPPKEANYEPIGARWWPADPWYRRFEVQRLFHEAEIAIASSDWQETDGKTVITGGFEAVKIDGETLVYPASFVHWAAGKRHAIPPQLDRVLDAASDERITWVFRKKGSAWECGEQNQTRIIKSAMEGWSYLQWLLRHPHKEFSPIELQQNPVEPTDHLANEELPRSRARAVNAPMIDEQAIAAIYQRRQELNEKLEHSSPAPDQSPEEHYTKVENIKAEISELDDFLQKNTRQVQGKQVGRELTTGDMSVRASDNLRKKLKRVYRQLEAEGLDAIAKHLEDSVETRRVAISYAPRSPSPKWLVD